MALQPPFPQSSALPGCATLRYAECPIFSMLRAQGVKSPLKNKMGNFAIGGNFRRRDSHENPTGRSLQVPPPHDWL